MRGWRTASCSWEEGEPLGGEGTRVALGGCSVWPQVAEKTGSPDMEAGAKAQSSAGHSMLGKWLLCLELGLQLSWGLQATDLKRGAKETGLCPQVRALQARLSSERATLLKRTRSILAKATSSSQLPRARPAKAVDFG